MVRSSVVIRSASILCASFACLALTASFGMSIYTTWKVGDLEDTNAATATLTTSVTTLSSLAAPSPPLPAHAGMEGAVIYPSSPACRGNDEALLYDQIVMDVYIEGNSETVFNRSLVCDNYAVLRDPTFEKIHSDYATYCHVYTFLDLNRSCALPTESPYMRTRENITDTLWDVGNEWAEDTCGCPALPPPSPPLSPPPSPPACARQEFDCKSTFPYGPSCSFYDPYSCFPFGGDWRNRENCPYCNGQYQLNVVPNSVNECGYGTCVWKCELACKSID